MATVLLAGSTGSVSAALEGSAAGTVRDLDGNALPGICVVAFRADGLYRVDLTDSLGRYRLDLAPEPHRIGAIGCRNEKFGAVYYPYKFTWETAGIIDVQAGQTNAVDFKLPRAAEVVGHVQDENGQVIPGGMWVDAIPSNVQLGICHGVICSYDPLIFNAFTRVDDSGNYRLRGMTPGPFKIRFFPDLDGFAPQYAYNKYGFSQADVVPLHSQKNFLNQTLHQGGVVRGRITGPMGQPAVGVRVQADYYDDLYGFARYTDADGNYELVGLGTGDYDLSFDPDASTGPYAPEYYNNKTSRLNSDPFFIRTGAVRPVDVSLLPEARITGLVTDQAGHPLKEICVWAIETAGSYVRQNIVSDATGRFVAANLAAGLIDLFFFDCNDASPDYETKVIENVQTRAATDTPIKVKLDLHRPGTSKQAAAVAPPHRATIEPGQTRGDFVPVPKPAWWASIPDE
jgi:hypothetical protein